MKIKQRKRGTGRDGGRERRRRRRNKKEMFEGKDGERENIKDEK